MAKTIDIAGQKWRLETFDDQTRADSAMGRCDAKSGLIAISKTLSSDVKEATILHEWIHGLLDAYGVSHDERVADVIANELFRQGFRAPVRG